MARKLAHIDLKSAEQFVTDVFAALGVPRREAAVCADVLICSDRRGIDSHGLNRVKPIYYDRIKSGILSPVTRFEITRETPSTAVVDGHNGMGHVIGKRCMHMAIRKARKVGIGAVAARNSTHFGIAGYYVIMAADAGMIGICCTNARPSIAPTFGVENMLGTNPLTFGMPTDEAFPFVLDCATSITQRGKIELYERTGRNCPAGWAIGNNGKPMTDSRRILKDLTEDTAALTPLGGPGEDMAGYKGYGYATVVEILSAALQSGSFMKALTGMADGRKVPIPIGHFFLAMDVRAFTDLAVFKKNTGDILRALRASKKAPGHKRIYTAGEKEHLASIERSRTGIPLPPSVQDDLVKMRDELGLLQYRFEFERGGRRR